MAIYNFDMEFVYILARWEGSTYDARVLVDAIAFKGFTTPTRKY
jgi:hypothetical protein